jgi:hypothetical protein
MLGSGEVDKRTAADSGVTALQQLGILKTA